MNNKIVIVGGVAGGASCAARLRRLGEKDEIVMFEKGAHVSFSNCCLPYHLSGVVCDSDSLVMMSPKSFEKSYNIDARVNSEVVKIDREKKIVLVKNTLSNEEYSESYDKLVLSPGAKPIVPNIKGNDKINIFSIRNVEDIEKLKGHIDNNDIKKISVIGGGFIGVETAENLREAGCEVTLIEAMNQIMRPFDYDMVQILHKVLEDNGIELILEDKVVEFDEKNVILDSGKKVLSEIVVMAIGVSPQTSLAKDSGLEIGETGAIKVDHNYMTNDPDIYAVGDAIEIYNALTMSNSKLPLAGPAQKQARAVADHIHGRRVVNKGFIGSSVIKVFDYNGASTGLTEGLIKVLNMNINYDTVKFIPTDKVSLMPNCNMVHMKLIFEVPTGRVLGAQAIGMSNVDKRIDVIATVIKMNGTIDDLTSLELCYAPSFSKAKDIVNYSGYIAENLLNGLYKKVDVQDVRGLVENKEYILDVREKGEFERGHIIGAINIPLSQIRNRLDEIPKDKDIYVHCKSGQRSYNAIMMLKQNGYKNTYNVMAGFMGLSYFEYFNDLNMNRKPILTSYLFQ